MLFRAFLKIVKYEKKEKNVKRILKKGHFSRKFKKSILPEKKCTPKKTIL
jgi:hypothetical protein